MIRAIHTAVRGRARYTVPGLYGSQALKRCLEFHLRACEGIQEIAASPRTGNVLVRFRPDISVETAAGTELRKARAERFENRQARTANARNICRCFGV